MCVHVCYICIKYIHVDIDIDILCRNYVGHVGSSDSNMGEDWLDCLKGMFRIVKIYYNHVQPSTTYWDTITILKIWQDDARRWWVFFSHSQLELEQLPQAAASTGAVCLDGTPAAYYLEKGGMHWTCWRLIAGRGNKAKWHEIAKSNTTLNG